MANGKRKVRLVAHNVRSALNVGSLLRTAEGLGVEKVFLTGYTPYPESPDDLRLPHQRRKQSVQIHKTALGAEFFIDWKETSDIFTCLDELVAEGYLPVALEQTASSMKLSEFKSKSPVALIVGNELTGIEKSVLKLVKQRVQIPMSGRKESFNVAVAAGIAIYYLRYIS